MKAEKPKSKPAHRLTPREQGKLAYRRSIALSDNPFQEARDRLDWTEGWIYQRTHYPSTHDDKDAADNPDCLSPWMGNDDGYNGYS